MDFDLVAVGRNDVAAVYELTRRWETHWEVPVAISEAEIGDEFDHPHLIPDLDTRGVWVDGRLAAFGAVFHTPSGERQERVFLVGRVAPDMRGNGIGRSLLAWQIERATEKLRMCDPAIPWYMRTQEWDWIDDALRLHRRFGLEIVRWFEEMARPLSAPLEVAVPDEISIVGWDEVAPNDLLAVSNEAFADHWGSTPRDEVSWNHVLASSTVRTDLSFVATVAGQPVGYSLNGYFGSDEAVTGRRDGWIESLGVTRPWRRRGIAAALIARSLDAFSQAGFTHAMLGVDADNPSGAAGLYSRLGFERLHRSVVAELAVSPI